jgi:Insertion element 4 transposase N-terminal/Transposase DDE domain
MGRGLASVRGRVLAGAGIGVLGWFVLPEDVAAVAGGRGSRLRLVPAWLGVYFVLGCCLFSSLPYGQVLRELTAGLEGALAGAGWRVPASTALTEVRRRVGEEPLKVLLGRVAGALSPGRAEWSHVGGLLAVAWDGTTVAVPGTDENAAAFGKPAAGKKSPGKGGKPAVSAGFPLVRLVALVACGTRAVLGAGCGPVRGKGSGEQDLARGLLGSLGPGMLLLADRNFCSYALWNAAAGTGADLLWRAKASMHLPVIRVLPDGSWLAHVNDPRAVTARNRKNGSRRRRGSTRAPETGPLPGITVRVIEFWLTVTGEDGTARTESCRLITTLADWRGYPAPVLAAAYARRWAIETIYAEFKTYLRGPGRKLRGRTPGLARQEIWACLTIYQALRALAARAAASRGIDPGRISFTATLHAARRTITPARANLTAALAQAETEITATLIPSRPNRVCVRAVKQPRSAYKGKSTSKEPLSQTITSTATITPPGTTTPTTPSQPKRTRNQPHNPP